MSDIKIEVIAGYDAPVIGPDNPGVDDNYYGFEGGRVFKHDGIYHQYRSKPYEPDYSSHEDPPIESGVISDSIYQD